MSVIAFKNPSDSPLGHLLEQTQRRRVAEEVNSAILRSQKQELGGFHRLVWSCLLIVCYSTHSVASILIPYRTHATIDGSAIPLHGRPAGDQAQPPLARHSR
jgi:hypothetical protein